MNKFCPRCPEASLAPRLRDGIEIDVCPSCRGVWLDRGELDKLLARASSELTYAGHRDYEGHRDSEPPSSRRGTHATHGTHPRRKRGLLESFGDLFD